MGKISAQPYSSLCIQFLNRENNDKNNTFPLGKQICSTIVWGCVETLPEDVLLMVRALNSRVNPLTTKSDQDRVSPYNINTVSSRQVMRVKKK